jgi:hypothetical protein
VTPKVPDLSHSAIFAPATGIVWVTIADEVVLYRVADAASLVLNSTAGLLWQCLDGRSRLVEIFDDLAHAFGADRAEVETGCVQILNTWLAEHLLTRVEDD